MSFGNGKTSPFLESIITLFKQEVSIVEEDRVMHHNIINASNFIDSLEVGPLELFG